MTAFEKFLQDKGYRAYYDEVLIKNRNSENKKVEHIYHPLNDVQISQFSTMGKLYNTWVLNDDFKNSIEFGLYCKLIPTIVYPRPNIERFIIKEDGKKKLEHSIYTCSDDLVNIALKTISFEKIYEAMFDKSIVFKFPDIIKEPIVVINTGYAYQSPTCAY